MTYLASGLLAAPGFNQFVVAPESSVDKSRVAIFNPGTPRAGMSVGRFCVCWNCRGIKYFLVAFMNHKCRSGFFGDECAPQFFAYVIGITAAHGHGGAEKLRRGARIFL